MIRRPKNYILSAALALGLASTSYAQQDLVRQIPANAAFVAVINSPAIIQHSTPEKINQLLEKAGLFDELRSSGINIKDINELALAYDRNAYIYQTSTDSTYYIGLRLPLNAGHQEVLKEHLFKSLKSLPDSHGYQHKVSQNQKTHIAWNDDNLLILTGDLNKYFFEQNSSAAARYGIQTLAYEYPLPTYPSYEDTVTEVPEVADAATDALADSVDTYWEGYDFDSVDASGLIPPSAVGEMSEIDPLEQENNDDPYYEEYDEVYQKNLHIREQNDSIQKAAFARWMANDFEHYLAPEQDAKGQKYLQKYDKKNTLIHFWAKDLGPLYAQTLAYSPRELGLYGSKFSDLIYAYRDIVIDLVQDKNSLKLQANLGVSGEMADILKPIYKAKMNRKFAKYIPQKQIGFLSLNFNSEAYLKSLPKVMQQLYSPMSFYNLGDMMDIFATSLEVALDEKAIAKVMGGDHVLFINELKKVKKEYVDYDYDAETFEYKEIKKNKDDYIPTFLWMFTSKDQRIFKNILDLGISREAVSLDHGIYRVQDKPKRGNELVYTLFKDDMVFLSNDQEQLQAIRDNKFQTNADKKIKNQIYKHAFTSVTHLSDMPETINRLGIPVVKQWDNLLNDLAQYGDLSISSSGFKKGRADAEIAIEFPKSETNALQYLLGEIFKNLPQKK